MDSDQVRSERARRIRPPSLLAPRRSSAALLAGRRRGSRRSIVIALVANVVIAFAKLGAGLITGSSALLAEAAHSTADSSNEILLGLSLRRARRPPDARHPFGYGGTRFLWAFLAAILSFVVGGCVSIALAVNQLVSPTVVDNFLVGWIVLAIAFVSDGSALLVSFATARREAAVWNQSTISFLRQTSDPTLRALVVEDSAALIGLALAASGLFFHEVVGWTSADGIASLLIGLLLAATAAGLARPLAELLIGQSIPPARLEAAFRTVAASPGVEEVVSIYAVHVAPQEAIIAAKVHPRPGQTVEELALAMDDLDHALRERLPEVAEVFIDVTSGSS